MRLDARLHARRGDFELTAELCADAGQTLVVAGPNGAGKSTLVEALAGLLELDAGHVKLDSETWEHAESGLRLPPQRRSVGVVFQGLWLFPNLSVRENVAYGLRARGTPGPEALRRADLLLEQLDVAHTASRQPRELSGGEAQLVALARALAPEPKLLLLDEPLSALDLERRPHVRALLQRALAEFPGVRVVITHDPLEALLLADRLAVLEAGRIVQSGSCEELLERPATRYVASLVGQNLIEGVLREPGRLTFDGGSLVVPETGLGAGQPVLARVEPVAIALSTTRPASSARNVLRGTIRALDARGDRVHVRLATTPPLVSEITLGAVRALALDVGVEVWASIKATEIGVYPRETIPSKRHGA